MAGRTSPLRAVRATTQITTQGCFCSYTGVPRAAATHCTSVQDRDPDRWATLGCELPAFHARALTFATSEAPGRSSAVAGRFRRAGGERRASWEALRSRTPRGRDSVCPWGHGPPRCPHDANALRVIEIRLASPDTATVVTGCGPGDRSRRPRVTATAYLSRSASASAVRSASSKPVTSCSCPGAVIRKRSSPSAHTSTLPRGVSIHRRGASAPLSQGSGSRSGMGSRAISLAR